MKKVWGIVVLVCLAAAAMGLLIAFWLARSLPEVPTETRAHSVIRYTAEYNFAFISQAEPLYTYPGENSVVCEVPQNTILTVLCMAVAADPDTGVSTDYLCVYTPTEKVPGNDIGWIPCSAVKEYTAEMAGQVDCPVRVREGAEYYPCAGSSDIAETSAQLLTRDILGRVYRREDGYCEVAQKGSGDFIWVAESDVEPNLIDAATVFASFSPGYAAPPERSSVGMSVEPISEHRLSVEITNRSPDVIYFDCGFELYTVQGERVPIAHDLLADTWQVAAFEPYIRPGEARKFAVTLSLLYGELEAGAYRLVKPIRNGETEAKVSAVFELREDMSDCTYPAEPYDDYFSHETTGAEGLAVRVAGVVPEGCTLYAENAGELAWHPMAMNGHFALYEWVDGEYMPVRSLGSYAYSAIGYEPLDGGDSAEYRIAWDSRYGKLGSGKYALVTMWSCGTAEDYTEVFVPVEFSIKE